MTDLPPEFPQATPAPGAAGLFDGPSMSDFVAPDHKQSRGVPPSVKKMFGKIGDNKKARGGPRQLKPEDLAKLEDYYMMMAFALQPFKPLVSEAIKEAVEIPPDMEGGEPTHVSRAHLCAQSWYELAQQNDSVRRMVLGLVETGAWSKVAFANVPILIAALPEDFMMQMMMKFMPVPNFPNMQEPQAA